MPFRIEVDKSRLTCKVSWEKSLEEEALLTWADLISLIKTK